MEILDELGYSAARDRGHGGGTCGPGRCAVSETGEVSRPAPLLNDDNHFYWDAAREGRLVTQRCETVWPVATSPSTNVPGVSLA